MQRVYMHSNEHFEVFTTVLAPQGRCRYRAEAEKMVAVHSYRPQWPDELELVPGDVILVLSKHEEGRWFGRLHHGPQGYFPASCVMELGQVYLPPRAVRRSVSLRATAWDPDAGPRAKCGSGHILQALKRGSRGGGAGGAGGAAAGEARLDGGQGGSEGPRVPAAAARRPQTPPTRPAASHSQQPPGHRSPGLLHRILSKCRKKTECQGATNGAFEGD